MKKIAHIYNILAAAVLTLVALFAASCEHKPLYEEIPQNQLVDIVFDWSNLAEGDSIPDEMTLYFYNKRTGEVEKRDVTTDEDTVTVEILSGDYTLITYDTDSPFIVPTGTETPETHEITDVRTDSESPVVYGTDDTPTIKKTEDPDEHQTLVITPKRITRKYNIVVLNTDSIEGAAHYSARLCGLGNSVYVMTGNCGSQAEEDSVRLILTLSEDGKEAEGSLNTFGPYYTKKQKASNKLVVYAYDDNSAPIGSYTFDVTDQIVNAKNPYDVTIIVKLDSNIPPTPPTPDPEKGDINVGVDEFPNDSINIKL